MGFTKDQLLARLKDLDIDFASYDHPVVLTVDAQAKYVGHLGGGLSKNLFLKDKKHRYYIVSALADTKVDLKVLAQRLGLGKGGIRMAPEEALQEVLQVPLGCVTPFALANGSARSVSLLLDQGFRSQERCFFHPLSNDMTISLHASGLDKFLVSIGRKPSYVDLEANTAVGKDTPPDLASLVPSDVTEKATPVQAPPEIHAPKEDSKNKKVHEAIALARSRKVKTEAPKGNSSTLAEIMDVKRFVEEIINKTTQAVQLEVKKEQRAKEGEVADSIVEEVKKRVASDLESLTMSLKNAAYTEGFHAGLRSVSFHK